MACSSSQPCYRAVHRDNSSKNSPTATRERSCNDLKENSSGTLGACRCSRLCYRSKIHDGCVDYPPNGSAGNVRNDGTVGNVDVSARTRSSSSLSGTCRCSKLCYMSKTQPGCVAFDPNKNGINNINESTDESTRDKSSSSLSGTCRCSRLCYRTKAHDGCVDYPPNENDCTIDNTVVSNRTKSSCSLSGTCRCSRLCYRAKAHDGCMDHPPNGNDCNVAKADVSDRSKSSSSLSGTCRCSRLCYKSKTHPGCVAFDPNSESKSGSCSDGKDTTRSLPTCQCAKSPYETERPVICVNYPPDIISALREAQKVSGGLRYSPDFFCGVTEEVPVKEGAPEIDPQLEDCLCGMNALSSDKMSAFSLDSMDFRYLEQVRLLAQQDKTLKHELEDLAAQEMAIRNVIKKSDQQTFSEKVVGTNNAKILRSANKDLSDRNEDLTDKVQDLHLEQDQLSQRINGPLSRELERLRKKYAAVRSELETPRNQSDSNSIAATTSEELALLKNQLQRTQQNVTDLMSVNDGIKQEVVVLECKCNQMEKVLIKQKLDETEAINKLKQPSLELSVHSSSTDKTISSAMTSCSCTDEEVV